MSSDMLRFPIIPLKAAGTVCSAILLLSCSVKEDRSDCPCFLTLDLGGVESAALMQRGLDSLVLSVVAGDALSVREAVSLKDNVQEYSVAVPKSVVGLFVGSGTEPSWMGPGGMHIPEGRECPVLYMHAESFTADAGEMRRTVSLHRNYCVLSVSMKTSYGARPRPYRISLEGNVSGYLMDGTPEDGVFICFSSPSSDGLCQLQIPRQRDD